MPKGEAMVLWPWSYIHNLERAPLVRSSVAEGVAADGAQPNMKEQRLEVPLVYVGSVKELTNLCSEYEILIAAQVPCAWDQLRLTGINLGSPCAP